jgi:glycine C-acetyltransferase/8-amino-7-oxononanoate synthase
VRVLVDEAQSLGTIGPGGRGAVAEAGLEGQVDVVTGSLGKALGSYGGFACCDHVTARFLVNSVRTLHHSTAPPPVAVAAAMAALGLLESEPRRVEKLLTNAETLRAELAREGFEVAGASTHIVPLLVGGAEPATRIVDHALEQDVFAEAVLPPAVPDGAARVRLAVMASHTRPELRDAARALARAALRAGVRPGASGPVALAHYDDMARAA